MRASIGYVPQALSADGQLTARENLEFYAQVTNVPRRERRARIDAAVESMGLEPMLDRLAKTFSGGMLRRLEIATALLNRPAVLFLDEPTVGLDRTARSLVWEHVHALRREAGTTVLDLLTRSVQPLLWLFVFGTALENLHAVPTGGISYRAYIAPGIMAQAAMFVAIFFGLAVIWERDVGQLQRLLATPLPRSALVLGKAAGASTRALVQAVLLLVVIAIAGIGLRWRVVGVTGALVLLAIGTAAFACMSMTIASLVKERERFMGIGQLVMMPLFFASSALYPLAVMPGWLHVVARVNPLTYDVEGLRGFLLGGGHPGLDLLVSIGWLIAFAAAATRAYPKAIL